MHRSNNAPENQTKNGSTQDRKTGFEIWVDRKRKCIAPEDLGDEDVAAEIAVRIESAQKQVTISLQPLLEWTDRQRLIVLDFIATLTITVSLAFRLTNGKKEKLPLFDAVVECLVDDADLRRFAAAKSAALEAAVLCHPDAIESACSRIHQRLQQLGVRSYSRRDLAADARKLSRELEAARREAPAENRRDEECVSETLEDAPVDEKAVIPTGWVLDTNGIGRPGEPYVIPAPVVIIERRQDVTTGAESMVIAWLRDGHWQTTSIDRSVMASSRAIVEALASYGAPVTSNNSQVLVQYLADYESSNLGNLTVAKVSGRLGWQGDKASGSFLLGEKEIGGKEGDAPVKFQGHDAGDLQIAKAFQSAGTLEGWLKAVSGIEEYPRVALALYASVAPPLLNIFDAPNFILDVAGRTTGGKTTTLRVAASVWGTTLDDLENSLVKTWDCTQVWRERAPAIQNCLPLFLDDTKRAKQPSDVVSTIYAIWQGLGRGRGSVKGLATQTTFRTVLITSGEQPITSFGQDGGTRARVLAMWGSPFGAVDAETGAFVRRLNQGVQKNYGHAGEGFVNYLVEHREQWPAWKAEYQRQVAKYEKLAADARNPFAGRMASHFATLVMAAKIVHQALQLSWRYRDPVAPLWKELASGAAEANQAGAALKHAIEWATAHPAQFCHGTGQRQPPGGWAGRWEEIALPGKGQTIKWIGFFPGVLKSILAEAGFEFEETTRNWADEGWIITSTDSEGSVRRRYRARVGRVNTSLIAIKGTAIKSICQT